MCKPRRVLACVLPLLLAACSRSRETPAPPGGPAPAPTTIAADATPAPPAPDVEAPSPLPAPTTTPNEFLARKIPTFVLGTAGDERSDRVVDVQVGLIRNLFESSATVTDDSIDVAAGPSAWPPNPVVYGGPDVSSVVARLAAVLPLTFGPDRIAFGEREFRGTICGHRRRPGARRRCAGQVTPSSSSTRASAPTPCRNNAVGHGGELSS